MKTKALNKQPHRQFLAKDGSVLVVENLPKAKPSPSMQAKFERNAELIRQFPPPEVGQLED